MIRSDLSVLPHAFLCKGQDVFIERGPLHGLQGTLVAMKANYRLVVAVSLLQRAVSAEIDLDWVRPLVKAA
jgi:transcription antitermination factor NusG